MSTFQRMLKQLTFHVDGAQRIDKAQINHAHELEFSINGTTWCKLIDRSFERMYALDDPHIPLADWASQQPACQVVLAAYRPGRRLVIKDPQRRVVLKGYLAGKYKKPLRNHLIAAAAANSTECLEVPELRSHDPSLACLTTSLCEYRPLHITRASGPELARIGAALASWQRATAVSTHRLSVFDTAQELAVVDQWRAKVERFDLKPSRPWRKAFRALEKQPIEKTNPVLTHRDLHDGQWMCSSEGLCLLDFDSLCLADPMLDPGNFLAHVDLRYAQWSRHDQAGACQKLTEFLRGYHQYAVVNAKSLNWFRAATLLRLALVYSIRPRWQYLSNHLSAKAEALLSPTRYLEHC